MHRKSRFTHASHALHAHIAPAYGDGIVSHIALPAAPPLSLPASTPAVSAVPTRNVAAQPMGASCSGICAWLTDAEAAALLDRPLVLRCEGFGGVDPDRCRDSACICPLVRVDPRRHVEVVLLPLVRPLQTSRAVWQHRHELTKSQRRAELPAWTGRRPRGRWRASGVGVGVAPGESIPRRWVLLHRAVTTLAALHTMMTQLRARKTPLQAGLCHGSRGRRARSMARSASPSRVHQSQQQCRS